LPYLELLLILFAICLSQRSRRSYLFWRAGRGSHASGFNIQNSTSSRHLHSSWYANLSLSLSLCVSATKKANTATFFLPGCPKRKTHKLVRHFYKRLGYCSQKQPCKSSRTAGVAVVQLYYVRGVCDHLVILSLPLIPLLYLPLECNKFPHGSTSTTLPSTNSWLCASTAQRE
jgi:hypothetical protein